MSRENPGQYFFFHTPQHVFLHLLLFLLPCWLVSVKGCNCPLPIISCQVSLITLLRKQTSCGSTTQHMCSCEASRILAVFEVPRSNRKGELEVPRRARPFPAAERRWDVKILWAQAGLRLSLGVSADAGAVPPEQYTGSHRAHWKGFVQHRWSPQLS